MPRLVRLLLAYDGTAYSGWQRQNQGEATVQATLEACLAVICGHPVTLHGAGRTDAGVHAQAMVAHFHTAVGHPLSAFSKGMNSLLPPDIRILAAQDAEPDFHSRFGAIAKVYRYDFFVGEILPPTRRLYVGHIPGAFNPEAARAALDLVLGEHDFLGFAHAPDLHEGGRGTVRRVLAAELFPMPDLREGWSLRLVGDGFLRQMVRIITGTVVEVGQGRREAASIPEIFASRDRRLAGKTAPACGLFLEEVRYPLPPFGRRLPEINESRSIRQEKYDGKLC